MFDLQFSTELSHYTLLSTHTAALVLSLWVLVLANGLITVPKANQVFATLRVRLFPERVGAWADDDVLHMGRMHLARCVVGQPLFMGAWLSLPFLWDREIFVWYFETALSLFPNYGDPVPWAVNAILGIWLVRTARSAWAVIREHGFLFGLLLLLLSLPVAVTTFAAGFFGSVYVLVPRITYLVLANRN